MSAQRKQYSAECKARVALEALKGLKTVKELASTYGVHPTHIAPWKPRLQKEMPDLFLGTPCQAGARPGGSPSAMRPANWTTPGGVGRGEKKSWSYHLRRSGS